MSGAASTSGLTAAPRRRGVVASCPQDATTPESIHTRGQRAKETTATTCVLPTTTCYYPLLPATTRYYLCFRLLLPVLTWSRGVAKF